MSTQVFFRGATAFFSTLFFDINGNPTQPNGALLSIAYASEQLQAETASIVMTAPVSPSLAWTAEWDSSLSNPGVIQWSISTTGGVPRTVQDGSFILTANAANLASAP